jgi:hypothetical protein
MKKNVYTTLLLLFFSIFVNSLNRAFNSGEIIYPYSLEPTIPISIAWYAKHVCELISFSLLMLCVCFILRPVEKHLSEVKWVGHNAIFVFVKVWHRIFWVIFFTSILDTINYLISFKQAEWFFLIQNGLFLIMTSYYLYKAFRK